ncbi:putative transporter [Lachnellula subtilissima]|uniref:Putative transporter n=1 Tax=Lachnellula subtilissima TaxID=602034 RepID=A0A8H8RKA0_9HELO|nr:putative transporter [Lachnellula subtilissima]
MASTKLDEKTSISEDITISGSPNVTPESLDDNYGLYKSTRDVALDHTEARKVLKKIDLRVLSILMVTYVLQYLDKNCVNIASVYGLKKDTHLKGQDYSWLTSMFYIGYLVFQFPFGYLLQHFPTGRLLSLTIIAWGVVLITTPACTSFAGIATNRFFLGALESAINPGFVLLISMFYTTGEQPLRIEAYYSTIGIATMFSGLIGYAVGHINTGLSKWQYIFLIFGAITISWGILIFFLLPDSPSTTRFLSTRERAVAVERVAANRQGIKNLTFKMYQAKQMILDPKTWILFIMALSSQIPTAAVTSFASINIASFGFDTLGTQYMLIPGGAVQLFGMLLGGWVATRWPGTRCVVMVVANTICIIGSGLLVGLPADNKGRLVALWLCYSQNLGFSMSLTMISSNVAGYTKKQLTAAVIFIGWCAGNIAARRRSSPKKLVSLISMIPRISGYHTAYLAMLIAYSIKLVMVFVLYIHMYMFNRKRDREQAATPFDEKEAIELGMHDATEFDNKGFRYIL